MPTFLSNLIGHILINALGSKTSTTIGLGLSYLNAAYVDYGKFIPAKYASAVSIAISILIAVFGAYMVDPSKVQLTAAKQIDKGIADPIAPTS